MASADYLAGGVHDIRLKPRLLRSVTRDLEDIGGGELGYIVEKIKIHELLTETSDKKMETKIIDEWRLAVDDWVERLLLLISDKMPQKRWAGTCLLGVTIEECGSIRVISSYSIWFEKLLCNIQASSNTRFIKEASCASLSDLFTRLANFSQVKKEATTFASRIIQPLLELMNNNNPIHEGAVDLLCTLVKFYPSSVHRYYDKVENTLASIIVSVNCNLEVLKKYANALALLPNAKGDSEYWSIMMQKVLITINTILNDALQGLEEEGKGVKIMKLLVPPGKDSPGLLGNETKLGGENANLHAIKRLSQSIIPMLSTLTYSCSVMLTSPYSSQVNLPIKALLDLINRVLSVDGSLVSKSVLPSTTSLYQELLCSEIPSLHLNFIDLLISAIKGLHSQILPFASDIVRVITDYFRRASLPSIRIKVYNTLELLLNSMGVGMSLYLAEHVVSNTIIDLEEGQESKNASKLGNNEILLKTNSPKKRKRGRKSSQMEETNEMEMISEKRMVPLSVKIAALKAIETLLSVGGSVKSETWRPEVDRLLINVANSAFNAVFINKGMNLYMEESSKYQFEFRFVALQALLASLLSPCHVTPPYLSQGLQLFQKGKLETGTEVGLFCEKALLALEVLIHPRDLPLVEFNFPGFQKPTLNDQIDRNELENEEMYCGWIRSSDDEKQPESPVGEATGDKMEMDVEKASHDIEEENEDVNHDQIKEDSEKSEIGLARKEGKNKEVMYDSESDSLGSIPDIVDADPDSD